MYNFVLLNCIEYKTNSIEICFMFNINRLPFSYLFVWKVFLILWNLNVFSLYFFYASESCRPTTKHFVIYTFLAFVIKSLHMTLIIYVLMKIKHILHKKNKLFRFFLWKYFFICYMKISSHKLYRMKNN